MMTSEHKIRHVAGLAPARAALVMVAWGAMLLSAVSCADSNPGGGEGDASFYCTEDSDCPPGMSCEQNICVNQDGGVDPDGGEARGNLNAFPDTLDFGFAPLHVDTEKQVTLLNDGDGDLRITHIRVVEDDQLDEFFATPSGDVDLVLPPGESTTIRVILHPDDSELDLGTLEIVSDDPDSAITSVALISDFKGTETLDLCVLPDDPNAEAFVDCEVDSVDALPILDYGVVSYQTPETRLVAIRNGAQGNRPLQVDSVQVTASSAQLAAEFHARLYVLDTDGVTELPVSLPVLLGAGDATLGLEPEILWVEVTFDAGVEGAVEDTRLEVETNDPGARPVPIVGIVSGCRENYWDINGDPADGCEYYCVYQGAEVCGNSVDDNCNARIDEAGALGCTTYYRDDDEDTFGQTADATCLCSATPPDPYTATDGGDCDDADAAIHPDATEDCDGVDSNCDGQPDDGLTEACVSTNTWGTCSGQRVCDGSRWGACDAPTPAQEACNGSDDDCDGIVDEEDALGCTTYYRDDDGDGYGQTADSRCLCSPSAPYTSVNSGDCNDGAFDVNPGRAEICDGVDNNCADGVDEEGAQGCSIYYRDQDGDNYGVATDSRCLCGPSGDYDTTTAGDCNDGAANANPGATEVCDGIDNDCDGAIDEEGSQGCTTYFRDGDGDGYGLAGDSQCLCGPSGAYTATVTGDCNDGNLDIHPGATEVCDGVDNDCDGAADEEGAQGCTTYFRDGDGDGYGVSGDSRCLCNATAPYTATVTGDCADSNPDVNPGETEVCNGIDDNCINGVDEQGALGCTTYYYDYDDDGWGTSSSRCYCSPTGYYRATSTGDCDDYDDQQNPAHPEICDDKDNDCDGTVDSGSDGGSNDTPSGAQYLGEVDDSGGWYTVSGSLSTHSDVDWFYYRDNNTIWGQIYPEVQLTVNPGSEYTVCAYYDCVGNDNSGLTCDQGNRAWDGPSYAPDGCCSSTGVILNHDCSGSDDTADIYVKIYAGNNTQCADYTFEAGDE